MKKASSTDKYELVTEINMIPFIDVSLVLLIIFMVMTPFLVKEQIKINLPQTKSVNTPVDEHRLLQVDVTHDGTIYVDGENVKEDAVYDAIRDRLKDPDNQPVVIAADRDVAFEHVVAVMDAAKRCGAKRLGVSAKHEGGETRDKETSSDDASESKSSSRNVSAESPKRRSGTTAESSKRRSSGESVKSGKGESGSKKSTNTSKQRTRTTERER